MADVDRGARRTVAALYIDPRGPYPRLPGVDCWDAERDARLYAGPHPVVAHPPCGAWGRMKLFDRGLARDCAPIAVSRVRRWGGVLEHPSHSGLWLHERLPRPGELPDEHGGYTLAVEQVSWGHVARKATWLYVVGVDRAVATALVRTGNTPTHWVRGSRSKRGGMSGGIVPPGIKICSAQQRRRTPPAFAEWLVELARTARATRPEAAHG